MCCKKHYRKYSKAHDILKAGTEEVLKKMMQEELSIVFGLEIEIKSENWFAMGETDRGGSRVAMGICCLLN